MTTATGKQLIRVALVGNPNTGKSTIFNSLSGLRQQVGNYPGVTVEKKIGRFNVDGISIECVDLPGTYSLAARSADELVAVEVLSGGTPGVIPDAILCVVDANNLERNLFLFTQLMQFELPLVMALNMTDVAARNGVQIDIAQLSQRLGVPVIPLQANKGIGIAELRRQLATVGQIAKRTPPVIYPASVDQCIRKVADSLEHCEPHHRRLFAERALLDPTGTFQRRWRDDDQTIAQAIEQARKQLTDQGTRLTAIESISRYAWIEKTLAGVVVRQPRRERSWSDRADRILTHRVWGTTIFAIVILLVFQSVFAWAEPLMGWVEAGQGWLANLCARLVPEGMLQSLLINGVIAGVGGVVVFVPQIMILFLFIAIMEDCGYLARTAYLMDKLMSRIGLSGKSFIPLLSSFACAIPGIMATRIIENRRDRLITILVAPLMSCSARLPVYTLLIAAFIPAQSYFFGLLKLQGLTLFLLYMLGVVTAAVVAFVLRKTILKGETPPFVMELPEYKIPSVRLVLWRMFDRGWAFVRRAGTLIVSVSILIWVATYFPRYTESPPSDANPPVAAVAVDAADEEEQSAALAAQQMKHSYLGRASRWVEPAVRPLGWDWKIAAAVIASFPAREVVVAALGVIYSLGDEQDENSLSLRERLQSVTYDDSDQLVYSLPTALSLLVFFALCAQCVSTLAIIRRETNSWRWPVFSFTYMTVLAYLAALVTYQIASRL